MMSVTLLKSEEDLASDLQSVPARGIPGDVQEARVEATLPALSPRMSELARAISMRHGLSREAGAGLAILQMHRGPERLMLLRMGGTLIVAQLNRRGGQYAIDRAARYNITSYGLVLDREMRDVRRDQGLGTVDRNPAEHRHLLWAQYAWTDAMETWACRLLEDGWAHQSYIVTRIGFE